MRILGDKNRCSKVICFVLSAVMLSACFAMPISAVDSSSASFAAVTPAQSSPAQRGEDTEEPAAESEPVIESESTAECEPTTGSELAVGSEAVAESSLAAPSVPTEEPASSAAASASPAPQTDTAENSGEEAPAAEKTPAPTASPTKDTETDPQKILIAEAPITRALGGELVTMSLGRASIDIVDVNDGQITSAEQFTLGAVNSDHFSIAISMSTDAKESFRFTVPAGFHAEMQELSAFTLTQETQENGDVVYNYTANNDAAEGSFTCHVTSDFTGILEYASSAQARFTYEFGAKVVSADGSTVTEAGTFTIEIPPFATYSLRQVDTYNNNFIWTPLQLAGTTVNQQILHTGNQADKIRPGTMPKKLQVEIQKESGSTIQPDWSLDMPLPLYWLAIPTNRYIGYPVSPQVEILVDGTWRSMTTSLNAFQMLQFPASAQFNICEGNVFGLPTNLTSNIFVNEQILTLRTDLADAEVIDAGLGTSKTVYEWFSEASAIRIDYTSDAIWDPVFNGQTAEANLSSALLSDDEETYTANDVTRLTAGGEVTATQDPMVIHFVNGSDQTLKVGIGTIDKIKMDLTTSKVTDGNDGYAAMFATAKNDDYAYFTDFTASYDFPWEYSPTGTITFCPSAIKGNYNNERNLTAYSYTITVSNTENSTPRVLQYPFMGYKNPTTGAALNSGGVPYPSSATPELAENEWISNITVTAPKIWKQSFTKDTSLFNSTTMNHPLFYANCSSKGTDVSGVNHVDGDTAEVTCSVFTDQTGLIEGDTETVMLIGPKDNMQLWSVNDAENKCPIGAYGEASINEGIEYVELHLKKYTDTVTYTDPYIEITGDAVMLLNKITYASNVGIATAPQYNYLNLRGYRLNTGDWVDVSDAQAQAMLNAERGYFDLSSVIPAGAYLTGVRLSPDELNALTVDTLTTPSEADPYDGETKHYQEQTYYLYLYDKVWPDWLGYNETLAKTYTDISDLNSPLSYDITFHCDRAGHGTHTGEEHLKADMTEDSTVSATLIFGDFPQKIFGRDNNYDVETAVLSSIYKHTELTNIAIDDGPADSSTINAWGEMQSATLKFGSENMTAQEKQMLALTKGVSLVGSQWNVPNWRYGEHPYAVVRYKTNLDGETWNEITNYAGSGSGWDRDPILFNLAEGEYVTAIEVDYPIDFSYRAGYISEGKESASPNIQLPDVGLLTNGQIPFQSPVEGDDHMFHNGETLAYHAELTFTDLAGTEHILPLDYQTARIQPYPTMLVDNFTTSVSYKGDAYQGDVLTATLTHKYSFTALTKGIDTSKVIHPTMVYELNKNFTIADTAILASQLGVNPNQVSLSPKNDGSGNSILKIEYGPQMPRDRDVEYTITLPLFTKANASITNIKPIKNAWLTLDYDTGIDETIEGEYVQVNPDSTQLEASPSTVLDDSDWENEKRRALVTTITPKVYIYHKNSSSMVYTGTDGHGGGVSQEVKGRDGTDKEIFGITETLYAPLEDSTNWVIYIAVPSQNQKVPYGNDQEADASEYGLFPAEELQLNDTGYTVKYWIPNSDAYLVPSMEALSVTAVDTISSLESRDDTADADHGSWKAWEDISDEEKENIAYVRILVDRVESNALISSQLLMTLKTTSAKTRVDDMNAYTSLIYNYVKSDGTMAFPALQSGNMRTNGKGSALVTYVLTDFLITGQLWQEKNFNNTFVSTDNGGRDILTREHMSLALCDENGNILYHKDGTTVNEVDIREDGSYTAKVPCHGTYFLTLTAEDEHNNWLPVLYEESTTRNASQFVPGVDRNGNEAAENTALAEVEVTSEDIQNINGGIEEWGTLAVNKDVLGAYANRIKQFSIQIRPDGATLTRTYTGTFTNYAGVEQSVTLTGGSDNAVNFGGMDGIELRLPVGLGYTIMDDCAGYTTTVETLENGQKPSDILLNPYTTTKIQNQITELTYTGDTSNGGNVENITNVRKAIAPTGVGTIARPDVPCMMMLICVVGFVLLVRSKRHKRL